MMDLSSTINDLVRKSEILRAAVPEILTRISPDDIGEQMILRDEYRNDVQRVIDALADKIGEMEAFKRKLRQIRADQKTDIDKLEAQKWTQIRSQPRQ